MLWAACSGIYNKNLNFFRYKMSLVRFKGITFPYQIRKGRKNLFLCVRSRSFSLCFCHTAIKLLCKLTKLSASIILLKASFNMMKSNVVSMHSLKVPPNIHHSNIIKRNRTIKLLGQYDARYIYIYISCYNSILFHALNFYGKRY